MDFCFLSQETCNFALDLFFSRLISTSQEVRTERWSSHTAGPKGRRWRAQHRGFRGPGSHARPRSVPRGGCTRACQSLRTGNGAGRDAGWRLDVRVLSSPGPERVPRGAHTCCSRVSGGREGGSHGLPRSPEALARPKVQEQKARMLSRLVGARGSPGD